MSTATQDQPAQQASTRVDTPPPHDPENDIDAKSATWWVLGGTIVLFISLWAMLPIFVRVQEEERKRKVDSRPNAELTEAMQRENEFLAGANPQGKSLEQVMQEALKK